MNGSFYLWRKPHLAVDVAPFLRPFHALRHAVRGAVRRGAFFHFRKGVHGPEIRLPIQQTHIVL